MLFLADADILEKKKNMHVLFCLLQCSAGSQKATSEKEPELSPPIFLVRNELQNLLYKNKSFQIDKSIRCMHDYYQSEYIYFLILSWISPFFPSP